MGLSMHGLVNRSIQSFLRDTYGAARWREIAEAAGADPHGFETMLHYDDALTDALLAAAAARLGKSGDALLEDLGIYLVTHPHSEAPRRLLRFGGVSFVEFLYSLGDLRDRGRLAVPDLDLPQLDLQEHPGGRFSLWCEAAHPGFLAVVFGVLQAMADDYGALVMLERRRDDDGERIFIDLLDRQFTQGRSFEPARGVC